jgi:putative hydrolase of the HAD superfamily
MKKYKHIFFDLDRTLWDFDKNALEAYRDIYEKYCLNNKGVTSFKAFTESYLRHNTELWALYIDGKIEKSYLSSRRFELTLLDFGINDPELAKQIGVDYITISPQKTNLFPNSIETLEYLSKRYPLHIITNGFEEVQFNKLRNSGLEKYFNKVITSEAAGCKKPDDCIFKFALKTARALPHESLMIGDDIEVDIVGAKNNGIDTVYFNPGRIPHNGGVQYEIFDLIELKTLI